MVPTSYSTRAIVFAYLVGPPRILTRQEGAAIHGAVCEKLGDDDFSFQYTPPSDAGQEFSVSMTRKREREEFTISISGAGQGTPTRVLFHFDWPPTVHIATEDIDQASEAIFAEVGEEGYGRVLAEARIRGKAEAAGDSAAGFLTKRIFHFSEGELGDLGARVSFAGITYETDAADATDEDSLANPKRTVTVEVLRDDPRCLYVEVMSQWPQLPGVQGGGTIEINPSKIRTFTSPPSDYVRNAIQYTEDVVLPLLDRS